MKRMLVFLAVVFSLTASAFGQRAEQATPWWANLDRFPIYERKLTVEDMARLELHPMRLEKDVVVLNWHKARGRFVFETLKVGTTVLADKEGVYRYKADCGNRVTTLKKCPTPAAVVTPAPAGPGTTPTPPARTDRPGFWRSLGDSLWNAVRGIGSFLWDILRALLGLLALLLALALLLGLLALPFYLLYLFLNRRRERREREEEERRRREREAREREEAERRRGEAGAGPRPVPPVPPVVPAAPIPPAPVPPAPAPAPAAPGRRFINFTPGDGRQPNFLRFGGYREVRFEEEGGVTTLRFS